MAHLNVRGINCSDTASEFSSDEVGTIDNTFLFPKWWDKKGNNVEYIRVFKLHITRVCDDIDIIIPASTDVEIRGSYDGNVTFRIDYHRGVKRMALTAPNSTVVDAEYIFPTRPSQKPRYIEYGAGPVTCFDANPLGSWALFYLEHSPNLDLGDYSAADGFYDLNQEETALQDLGLIIDIAQCKADVNAEYSAMFRKCETQYCRDVVRRDWDLALAECETANVIAGKIN